MFYIKFKFNRKSNEGSKCDVVEDSFLIAGSEAERNQLLSKLMSDPIVHDISVQEYSPVGEVQYPVSFNVEFADLSF